LSTIVPDRPNDIVGKHLSEALGAEVYDHVAPAFEAARRGEAPVLEFEHKSSGTHLRVAFTPDTDDQGVVNGAYLLSANVTEQALSRQALTHTRRRELAAQLTSGLAHDFGNLLTIIMGEQDRLSRLNNLPDKADRYLETIKSAARRGAELIDGLSQLDAQRTIDIRLIDFQIFLKETMLLAQATLPDGITLTLNNTLEASHLMLDSGFASDALLNLVFNSIDAMNGTGDISVNVSVQKHRLLSFAVEDTGSGFSDNALANGLAPFFTSKSDRAGRGLGLSTAFDFARSSGGTVRLSNRETGGACVTITLPYLPSKPNTPGMVLLVEDNAAIRETVRAQLQRLGNSVIETDNALEAEKLACMPDVTFVVSDLVLEGGPSGYDLAQTLRKNNVSVPILIITGLPKSDPRRQQAQEQYQVLQKPFNFGQLAERLQMDQTS
jgi:signal transduction histidine kinase/CheY-like chemotaxis protein